MKRRIKRLNEATEEEIARLKEDIAWTLETIVEDPYEPMDAQQILDEIEEGQYYSGHRTDWWANGLFDHDELVHYVHEVVKEFEAEGKLGDFVFISDED